MFDKASFKPHPASVAEKRLVLAKFVIVNSKFKKNFLVKFNKPIKGSIIFSCNKNKKYFIDIFKVYLKVLDLFKLVMPRPATVCFLIFSPGPRYAGFWILGFPHHILELAEAEAIARARTRAKERKKKLARDLGSKASLARASSSVKS
jgi:hypothetical protein